MKLQTTELLERFVELPSSDWGFRYRDDTPGIVWLMPNGGGELQIDPTDDRASAEAIIFLWDWLQDQFQFISIIGTEDGFVLERTVLTDDYGWVTKTEDHAPTRIEALVRACIAVLESKQAVK